MSQKPGTYHYQQKTTTTRTVSIPSQNKYTTTSKTVTTTKTTGGSKPKIDLNTLNHSLNVQLYKCNKCGKFKYNMTQNQTTTESGSWSRKTDITEINKRVSQSVDKSFEKYSKYNKAAQEICKCGMIKAKCICNKKGRSTSVTTTTTKRSANVQGKVDLTPKVKVN